MILSLVMLFYGPLSTAPRPMRDSDYPQVSGVTVTPQKDQAPADARMKMAGSDADAQMVGIWPGKAYRQGADGRVRLKCWIDAHGLAERCEVIGETPKRMGFGQAAMEMRPIIKLPPTMGPDGPVGSYKTIDIGFEAPDVRFDQARFAQWQSGPGAVPLATTDLKDFMQGNRSPLPMRKVTMLDNPVWISAASFDDLVAAYPGKPGAGEGYAVDHCMVRKDGGLEYCQTIMEEPTGHGFGKAALGLAARFKVSPTVAAQPHADPLWVDIPVRFPSARELAERTVMAPTWVQVFDTKATPKLFPPEAASAGLTSGRGVARCAVAADGGMVDCAPEPGAPDGQGFSEAAVKLAATMKMNLWSADGAPVQGGVVHLPIRLNLKGAGSLNPAQ